jgi:hypothetical protein
MQRGLERDCGDNKRGLQRMKSISKAAGCPEQMNLETTNSEKQSYSVNCSWFL